MTKQTSPHVPDIYIMDALHCGLFSRMDLGLSEYLRKTCFREQATLERFGPGIMEEHILEVRIVNILQDYPMGIKILALPEHSKMIMQ